jgi:hypothetical protein
MVRRLACHNGAAIHKFVDEKAAAHLEILSHYPWIRGPKAYLAALCAAARGAREGEIPLPQYHFGASIP